MITIAAAVKEIIEEDESVLPIFQANLLNLSRYARVIQPEVAKRTFKEVELPSIIVALSRLVKSYPKYTKFNLQVENVSVHSNLVDISFEKTAENIKKIAQITSLVADKPKTFFTITQGITEITVLADKEFVALVKEVFQGSKPLFEIPDLTGITVKTDARYLNVPKVFYTLVQSLQAKKISITEIVSTTTEITFVIPNKDAQVAIGQLSKYL